MYAFARKIQFPAYFIPPMTLNFDMCMGMGFPVGMGIHGNPIGMGIKQGIGNGNGREWETT